MNAKRAEAERVAREQAVAVARLAAHELARTARELCERRVPASWRPAYARALDSGQFAVEGGVLRVADGELLFEPHASASQGRAAIRVQGRQCTRVGPHVGPPVLLLEDRPDGALRLEVRDGVLRSLPGESEWHLQEPAPGVAVLDDDAAHEVAEELVRRVLLVHLVRRGADR